MYRKRAFDLVTINTNAPADAARGAGLPEEGVRVEPEQAVRHRRSRRPAGGLGREVEPAAPLTMVIAPGGEVLYRRKGRSTSSRCAAPSSPHARHQRLHRVEGVLDEDRRGGQGRLSAPQMSPYGASDARALQQRAAQHDQRHGEVDHQPGHVDQRGHERRRGGRRVEAEPAQQRTAASSRSACPTAPRPTRRQRHGEARSAASAAP